MECHYSGCDNPGKNRCKGCKVVRYCSKECQEKDWKAGEHKQKCKDLKFICKFCCKRNPEDFFEKGLCIFCGDLFCSACIRQEAYSKRADCPNCGIAVFDLEEDKLRHLDVLEKRVRTALRSHKPINSIEKHPLFEKIKVNMGDENPSHSHSSTKEKKDEKNEKNENEKNEGTSEESVFKEEDEEVWAKRLIGPLFCFIGNLYYRGDGVMIDYYKSLRYFTESVSWGSTVSNFYLYKILQILGEEPEIYIRPLKVIADAGFHLAMLNYAMELKIENIIENPTLIQKIRYEVAKGAVDKLFEDVPELTTTLQEHTPVSYEYLSKSIAGDLPDTYFELGTAFQFGQVPGHEITRNMTSSERMEKCFQLIKKAIFWYKKAALKGHGKAANNIGVIYKMGFGVQQDLELAEHYFTLSDRSGSIEGTFGLGNVAEKRGDDLETVIRETPSDDPLLETFMREKNGYYNLAAGYYASSAKLGFLSSKFKLGYLMLTDRFCMHKNRLEQMREGFSLINEAALHGHETARIYLLTLRDEVASGGGDHIEDILNPSLEKAIIDKEIIYALMDRDTI